MISSTTTSDASPCLTLPHPASPCLKLHSQQRHFVQCLLLPASDSHLRLRLRVLRGPQSRPTWRRPSLHTCPPTGATPQYVPATWRRPSVRARHLAEALVAVALQRPRGDLRAAVQHQTPQPAAAVRYQAHAVLRHLPAGAAGQRSGTSVLVVHFGTMLCVAAPEMSKRTCEPHATSNSRPAERCIMHSMPRV